MTGALCSFAALHSKAAATIFVAAHPTGFTLVSLFVISPHDAFTVMAKHRLHAGLL